MRTPTWKDVNLGIVDGFKMVLSFEEENINPRYHFIKECGWSVEQYKEISNFYFFCAKVSAYKGNILCGDNYLGANCYKNKKEVLGDGTHKTMLSGYIPQMIEEAIEEAKDNLAG